MHGLKLENFKDWEIVDMMQRLTQIMESRGYHASPVMTGGEERNRIDFREATKPANKEADFLLFLKDVSELYED